MKRKIVCFAIFICSWTAFDASAFTSDREYAEQIVVAAENRIRQIDDDQSRRIGELESKVVELSEELSAIENWTKEKWGVSIDELKRGGGKRSGFIWLLLIVFVIVAILAFAFWPRRRLESKLPSGSGLQPKCPRCGWEHDPGDTACKNPACKMHF